MKMIIYYAGCKPATEINWWDDFREAMGEDLNTMTTYWELRRMGKKKQKKFMDDFKRSREGKNSREFWKWIPGYKGYYKVSNFGRVRSMTRIIKRRTGNMKIRKRILKPGKKNGYFVVVLCKGQKDKPKQFYIHHLVLRAFKGECPPGKECRHRNGRKVDNHIDNLRWGTRVRTKRIMYETEPTGINMGCLRINEKTEFHY